MMKRIAIVILILFLMLAFLPAGVTYAQTIDRVIEAGETVEEEVVVFGGNLLIKEGALVEGDVSVFGGTATIKGDVDGDVIIFGGTTELSGMVDGDLVIFGGNLRAMGSAEVDGDCILLGGNVSGNEAGGINCTTVGEFSGFSVPAFVRTPAEPRAPELPSVPERPHIESPGIFGTISSVAGRSLVLGLFALLIAAVAPVQLVQVRDTMKDKPAASGAVGLLTAIAGASLVGLLLLVSAVLTLVCIGLLGFPIVFILSAALGIGAVMGWVAAGTLLGQWLARVLKLNNRTLAVTAGLGTIVLTLVTGLFGALPFFLGGWVWTLGAILIGFAGLGAVALTRFGTRPYPYVAIAPAHKVDAIVETLPVEDDLPAVEKTPPDEG